MRQNAGYATAEESNARYRYLLERGQTGLSVAFDLPTQMGYDSDHQMAEGEVGKVGVAIDTLDDMETLLAGIPLDRVSTSMTINSTAPILLALYVAVGKFAPRLAFFFDSHNELFEEVAKFRAARRMWAKIMRERFGATNLRSWMLRFHTQTAGVSLQAQQIDTNVVRVTVQALAAILGGTQSLHTNAKDEALALPTAETAELALRTQQVLAYESGVADVVDPLAGSYYVETLTNEVEQRAWDYIQRIDERGGALQAVESGYIQAEITEAAYEYQRQVERGERIIVGTNRFQSTEAEPTADILTVDPGVRERQCQRLQELRARRDNARCQNVLERLQAAAGNERENLLPLIVDAIEAYCTLGEISDAFRAVWGEARDFGRI